MAGSVSAIHPCGETFFMELESLIANVLRLSALGLVSWLLSPLTRPAAAVFTAPVKISPAAEAVSSR